MAQLTFNDTTGKMGMIQAAERRLFNGEYGRISDDEELLKEFTARINTGLDWYFELQQRSDTRWQGDDRSYTTYPDYTETLVEGQNTYPLNDETTKIKALYCTNADGNKYRLFPLDRNDSRESLDTRFNSNGQPQYYDKYADSIVIYPAPDANSVTLSEGLEIFTSRTPNYFVYNDTSAEPGMTYFHHEAPVDYACWSYAEDNDMSNQSERLFRKLFSPQGGWENRITSFYQQRDVDDRPRLTVSYKRNLNRLH